MHLYHFKDKGQIHIAIQEYILHLKILVYFYLLFLHLIPLYYRMLIFKISMMEAFELLSKDFQNQILNKNGNINYLALMECTNFL